MLNIILTALIIVYVVGLTAFLLIKLIKYYIETKKMKKELAEIKGNLSRVEK